jgi:hypothetical protein
MGDVIHAYSGYNVSAIQNQLMGITSLFKDISELWLIIRFALIKKFYAQEIVMSTMSVEVRNLMTAKFYWTYVHVLKRK